MVAMTKVNAIPKATPTIPRAVSIPRPPLRLKENDGMGRRKALRRDRPGRAGSLKWASFRSRSRTRAFLYLQSSVIKPTVTRDPPRTLTRAVM